jgi:hypothetical protein
MADGAKVTRAYFRHLHGLPCWQASGEVGTWLSLHFGAPRIVTREPIPDSKVKSLRRRKAWVNGEYHLWIEMAAWEYTEPKGPKLKPRSRESIRRVAALACGQVLKRVTIRPRSRKSIFQFDYGTLTTWPYADLGPDDPLWHLYTRTQCLTLQSGGLLTYGPSANEHPKTVPSKACVYDV